MGLFARISQKETQERAKWITGRSGEVDEAIKAYRKGKASKESVRQALRREDSYFDFTE